MSIASVMAAAGAAVAVLAGSYVTALAVVDGDLTATFVRFTCSIIAGVYYVYVYHLSRGRRPFAP